MGLGEQIRATLQKDGIGMTRKTFGEENVANELKKDFSLVKEILSRQDISSFDACIFSYLPSEVTRFFEQEIIDYLTCYSGISKDDVGILYYFGEYNGLHILMLKDDAGYPGDGGNHGTRKLYYYKDKNLKQLRIGLDRLIEQGYFTYEDYYEFRIISERIFIEVYGKNGQK